jgi:hypothetical protein
MPGAKKVRTSHVLALVGIALFLSAIEWWPALTAFPKTQWGDGAQYHKTLEAARVSITRYHELPLWNPYECGGLPLWDNPQSYVGTPTAWLTFLIGTTRTMEFWYFLHAASGFLCMWLLARSDLKLSRAASFVASAMWAYCGIHKHRYTGGHTTFAANEYMPLALFLWRRAEKDVRYAVGLGVLVAEMMYEGAVYPIPHFAVLLGAESLTRAWPLERLKNIAKAGAIAGVLAFLLAACRFLPVIDQLAHHERGLATESDYIKWQTLADMFLARSHPFRFAEQTYHWNEYGAYVGPILLMLAFLGVLSSDASLAWAAILLAFSFVLMLGHFAPFAPWHILKGHVFPFKEMRVPSRFAAEVSMFLAVFAGVALDRLPTRLKKLVPRFEWPGHLRAVMVTLALLGVGDLMSVGYSFIDEYGFHEAPQSEGPASARLYFGGPGLSNFISEPAQNRGRLQCWDEWGFGAGAPLWEGDVPQARAADDGANVVSVERTQNKFFLDVDVTRPSRILLNSTYDRGFRTNVGSVAGQDKELVLDLPPGHHQVVVEYWPHGLTAGLILSALSIMGVAWFFITDRRRRRAGPRPRLSGTADVPST